MASSKQTKKPTECVCCKARFAQARYSRIGDLCDECKLEYTERERGREEATYDWGITEGFGPGQPGEEPCTCCKLIREDSDKIAFECRHSAVTVCFPCARKHIDSLQCPKCKAQPKNLSKFWKKMS